MVLVVVVASVVEGISSSVEVMVLMKVVNVFVHVLIFVLSLMVLKKDERVFHVLMMIPAVQKLVTMVDCSLVDFVVDIVVVEVERK